MDIIKTVKFTPEEMAALQRVADIKCVDIKCEECPFRLSNDSCVRNTIMVILAGINSISF